MVLTVYKTDLSPPVRAVLMTIEALKIKDVNYVEVNLLKKDHFTEAYLKMNPQHTVPTLKDDDFVIWDSHAINPYLVTKYGQSSSLLPSDPKQRAVVDQRLHFDTGVLFPALATTVKPIFYQGEKSYRKEGIDKILESYEFLEKFLTKEWLAGDQLTLADINCVATVSSLNALIPIDGKKFPKLSAWLERCSKQDFFVKKNVPGLEGFAAIFKHVALP